MAERHQDSSSDQWFCAGARIQENPGANSRVFGGQAVVPADVLLGKTMAPHEFLVSPFLGARGDFRACVQSICPCRCIRILCSACRNSSRPIRVAHEFHQSPHLNLEESRVDKRLCKVDC